MFGVNIVFIKKQLHCFILVVTVAYYSDICVDYTCSFQNRTPSYLLCIMACHFLKYIVSLSSCSCKKAFGFDVCVEKV